MRLIDADALKQITEESIAEYGNDYYTGDMIYGMRCVVYYATTDAPTVDAVLIGWIEEQIRESYDASKEYDGCYDYAWALSELVKRWRVENGSVD